MPFECVLGLFFCRITETKLVDVWGREDSRGTWKMISDFHKEPTIDSDDDENEDDCSQTHTHNNDDEGDIAQSSIIGWD